MSVAVEAVGIGKRYGSLVAVEDLTFAVESGVVLGVLGPNGAGKTTAIRVLTTILQPSHGTFTVAGIPHTRPAEIRQRVGVLPESAGYPERQTAEEYLRFHASLFGHSRPSARAVARTLLEEVGLGERARSLIASYSRGMRQRLGIARALVNDPQVVFLDEPTLGLDPAGQRQILANVRGIASERGAAVLLSSHLLAEVEENCSRVMILNRGHVVADGTVAEIVRQAAAPRSARLQVAGEHTERAVTALAGAAGIDGVERFDGRAGLLNVVFSSAGDDDGKLNLAVRVLLDAGIELRSFELEGARLSDAFLAVTEDS
ncbi:MAG TPA: ABC transporter ATP-binding protein [Gaiellaceae bacterium]|nr:ABC transporter ATP-binding protein [Gaiellaceae bacterium]